MKSHAALGITGRVGHFIAAPARRITGVNTDRIEEDISGDTEDEPGLVFFVFCVGRRTGIAKVSCRESLIRNTLAGAVGADPVYCVKTAVFRRRCHQA